MNFLFTEESEQQKSFSIKKRIFEKQSPKIETGKKMLGDKFESQFKITVNVRVSENC